MTKRGDRRLVALTLGLTALGLVQCDRRREAADQPSVPAAPTASANPSLDRADLLAIFDRAAADHAAGKTVDAGVGGRTFLIRLAFACPGAGQAPLPGLPRWSRSEAGPNLELTLAPADWTQSPLVTAPGAQPTWEGVDGIWISRPWLRSEGCPGLASASPPAAPAAAPASDTTPASVEEDKAAEPVEVLSPLNVLPPAPSPMTAGLAVIAGAEASRLGRRPGEAWSHTIRGQPGAAVVVPPGGFRIVLGGRIGRFPDGRAVRCTSTGPDVRPVCIAAVELDLVAFEDASGRRLSEWRPT